jgi:hypothetical protein
MPSVVTFWQLPEDERDFLEYIHSTGDVLACASMWSDSKQDPQWLPPRTYVSGQNPIQLLITLAEFASRISTRSHKKGDRIIYGVDSIYECVITYTRGRFRENGALGQSSFSFYSTFPNVEVSRMEKKDPRFLNWAKRVLARARRFTPEKVIFHGFPYRATRRVKEAVVSGRIQVAH